MSNFNSINQTIDFSTLKPDTKVLSVLQLSGLRFLKQQVICEWVPIQMKVFDNSVNNDSKYIIDDTLLSDNEDDEIQISVEEKENLENQYSNVEKKMKKQESQEQEQSEQVKEEPLVGSTRTS